MSSKIVLITSFYLLFSTFPLWAASSEFQQERNQAISQSLDYWERETKKKEKAAFDNFKVESDYEPITSSSTEFDYRPAKEVLKEEKPKKSRVQSINDEMDFIELTTGFSAGIRKDELVWNIAGDEEGTSPNILSELSWTDLNIYQVGWSSEVAADNTFLLTGAVNYGWIMSGDNQDSDYFGDDRTFEFSRSNNNGEGDDVWDGSIGFGYQYELGTKSPVKDLVLDKSKDSRLWLAFLFGYSYHQQNLKMTDGFQTLDPYSLFGFTGAFDGLNSTYQAQWRGPWIGLRLKGMIDKIRTLAGVEYHVTDYYAKANWNLRTDFAHPISYKHYSKGFGLNYYLAGYYPIIKDWDIGLKVDYKDWNTKEGLDRTFFSDGTSADTQLNRVDWTSLALTLESTYTF